jgi:copper chaperone CopZ
VEALDQRAARSPATDEPGDQPPGAPPHRRPSIGACIGEGGILPCSWAAGPPGNDPSSDLFDLEATMTTVSLAIDGMSCGHCVRAVRDALAELPGVTPERIDIGAATLTLDPVTTSVEQVLEAVRDAGYEPHVGGGGSAPGTTPLRRAGQG